MEGALRRRIKKLKYSMIGEEWGEEEKEQLTAVGDVEEEHNIVSAPSCINHHLCVLQNLE